MAFTIDFSKKYQNLIFTDIPKVQLGNYPGIVIPEKYRKKFVHPKDGFVKLFCEEYDESSDNLQE